jgi:hypothetical protein
VFLETPGAKALMFEIGDKEPTAAQNAALQPIVVSSAQLCRVDATTGLS